MLTLQPSNSSEESTLASALSSFTVVASTLSGGHKVPPNSVKLRSLAPSDWPIVRYVSFAMAYDDLSVLTDEEGLLLTKPVVEWQEATRALAHPSNAYWIVEDGDTPVGSLYIRVCTPKLSELGNVWVAPRYRRHGLAQCLIEAAFRKLRAQHIGAVCLNVEASNKAAQRLYRKLGFAPTGRITQKAEHGAKYREYLAPLASSSRSANPRAIRRPFLH